MKRKIHLCSFQIAEIPLVSTAYTIFFQRCKTYICGPIATQGRRQRTRSNEAISLLVSHNVNTEQPLNPPLNFTSDYNPIYNSVVKYIWYNNSNEGSRRHY